MGLRPGTKISGMAFTQFDGTAYWDKAGLVSVNDPAQDPNLSLRAWDKFEKDLGEEAAVSSDIKALLKNESSKLGEAEHRKLRDYFLSRIYTAVPSACWPFARNSKLSGKSTRRSIARCISTMVSKELDKPRPTWLLIRGQYDKHGEPVGPGVPSILPPCRKRGHQSPHLRPLVGGCPTTR